MLLAVNTIEAGFEKSPLASTVIRGKNVASAAAPPTSVAIANTPVNSIPTTDHGLFACRRVVDCRGIDFCRGIDCEGMGFGLGFRLELPFLDLDIYVCTKLLGHVSD